MAFGFQDYSSNVSFGKLVVHAYSNRKHNDEDIPEFNGLDGVPFIGTGVNADIYEGVNPKSRMNNKGLAG